MYSQDDFGLVEPCAVGSVHTLKKKAEACFLGNYCVEYFVASGEDTAERGRDGAHS
jgi:hypothetical protein